jgi:hypothetical protein
LELRAEAAATRVANDLKTRFFAVVDEFLPPPVAAALAAGVRALHGSGLHASTFRLKVSAFCEARGAYTGC